MTDYLFYYGLLPGVLAPIALLVDDEIWESDIEICVFVGLSIIGWVMIASSYIF
ncbi:hypothetical protein BH11PAT2_BH11PAT2_07160 [soil metagenome]